MRLFRRSLFAPTRKLSRRRRALNLVRNVWFLRGELWAIVRKKKPERPTPTPLRCVACKHELTKPCRPGRARHLVRWPDDDSRFKQGQLVEVRRQKPRGGQYDKDDDLRPMLKDGEPVFL